jgi:trans-feruloyl-CoA hydratase/vanillin synthase
MSFSSPETRILNVPYSFKTLLVDVADNVAYLTLNRPEKRNAMSPTLHLEISEALEQLRYDDDVRVVVITGSGKAFCAGMDLKEFFTELGDKPHEYDRIYRVATDWRGRTLRYFPKPTIAMINGYCFGGAFSIVEGCDLAIAATEATFGLSEINFGLFPGGSVSKSLANIMRPRDAMLLGLTGRSFDGKTATEIGFVNYHVPADELRANVSALALELAAKNPDGLRATKEAYRHSLDMGWEAAIAYADARQDQLSMRQKNAWKEAGIGGFLAGEYRPGLEANPTLQNAGS